MKRLLATRERLLGLLFWPAFLLRYLFLERGGRPGAYRAMECSLDQWIPFAEVFVIPYVLWYGGLVGMHLWLCFREEEGYWQYTRYLVVTTTLSTLIFLIWPSCQNLRPAEFSRDNVLTVLVGLLYRLDTSTNVFPSEHVIGAAGFFLAAWHSPAWKYPRSAAALAILTGTATVFIKQHSVLDVLGALPVCAVGYFLSFYPHGVPEREIRPGEATA